jgi:hypothetical protein
MSYNLEVKIAGKNVSLKRFTQKPKFFNYQVKNPPIQATKGESERSRENFIKSIVRARKNVFDIIACNVNVIPDFYGNIQRPKFWTLTFAENVTDLEEANKEFTKFNKRLSYSLYGVHKNVLKYICIPEFQKRGAVHFHVLYFNMPYVEQKKLQAIWGNGWAWVESVSKKGDIEDFAIYVAKYISKENSKGEDNYDLYKEKEMLNSKRYSCSRGLNRPEVYKLLIDEELYTSLVAMLKDFHSYNGEYENEYIGKVELNYYEVENKKVKQSIRNAVNSVFTCMKDIYNRKVRMAFADVGLFMFDDLFFAIEETKKKIWKKYSFVEVPIRDTIPSFGW